GGWQATGGITFTGAPAEFRDCSFTDAHGEDLINLIGVRFHFERCRFDGGPNDLFDGDFVTGDVIDCSFANSGEDAIDVSGSLVTVRGCTFEKIGDKAFSVGEGSNVTAIANHVRSASIAVASKDRSMATIDDLTVDAVEHYVLAAFIKKPQFGGSHMVVKNLHWTGATPALHIAQTGCSIEVDGVTIPTEPIDVEALYRQKVLGK
ncbi:MAG: right-handed parallel beta-helix repeat-containing protein, partial [Planctomycetota bacterium]